MFFLRRAHELHRVKVEKPLSPLFWLAEGMGVERDEESRGFQGIGGIGGIEHPLGSYYHLHNGDVLISFFFGGKGRLLYTTGDTEGAVRLFLGLLRESPTALLNFTSTPPPLLANGAPHDSKPPVGPDSVFLGDFRVAYTVRFNSHSSSSSPALMLESNSPALPHHIAQPTCPR
jgi:trafficking protein particle complex subunit 8